MTRVVLVRLSVVLGLVLSLSAACGGSSVGGEGPCEGDTPDPACAIACNGDDAACPAGFHCGSDGQCTADCTAGGNECGAGFVCDPRGQCIAEDDPACPSVTVTPMPRVPTVQLLIDQSGSMDDPFGTTTRWQAVKNALISSSGVVTTLDDQIVFGASLYTYNRNNDTSCPRITKTPTRAFNNGGAITTLLNNASPDADTPTGESIRKVIADFQANPPAADSAPVILLATDGLPDRCANPDAHDATSRQLSVSAAQDAFTAGIRTIVLSVGNDVGDAHLQEVANAGAGQPPATGTERFYKANNPSELSSALQSILTGILSCEFDLSGTVDLDRASEATVEMSGSTCGRPGNLSYGTDWSMVDNNTIRISGTACDAMKSGRCSLSAVFGCGTIIP